MFIKWTNFYTLFYTKNKILNEYKKNIDHLFVNVSIGGFKLLTKNQIKKKIYTLHLTRIFLNVMRFNFRLIQPFEALFFDWRMWCRWLLVIDRMARRLFEPGIAWEASFEHVLPVRSCKARQDQLAVEQYGKMNKFPAPQVAHHWCWEKNLVINRICTKLKQLE